MEINVKNPTVGNNDLKLTIGQLIEVNGFVFYVSSLTQNPMNIVIQPANADQWAEFRKGKLNAPKLQGESVAPRKPGESQEDYDLRTRGHEGKDLEGKTPAPRRPGESKSDYDNRVKNTNVDSTLPDIRYKKTPSGTYLTDANGRYRRNDDNSYSLIDE